MQLLYNTETKKIMSWSNNNNIAVNTNATSILIPESYEELRVSLNLDKIAFREYTYENGTFIAPINALETYISLVKEELKKQFIKDISWTDSIYIFQEKRKGKQKNNAEDDIKYANSLTYWDEGYTHYDQLKVGLYNATSIAEVDAVVYNPTHAKSREEIE